MKPLGWTLVLFLAAELAYAPPQGTHNKLRNAFSSKNYRNDVATLSGRRSLPRRLGGKRLKNRFSLQSQILARKFLVWRLKQIGFDTVHGEEFWHGKDWEAQNLYVEIKGSKRPNEVVIVGAHYDSYGTRVPGANDNASGAAAVLGIAQAFKKAKLKPQRTIRFVFFDEEEVGDIGKWGFVGSSHHLDRLLIARKKPVLFLNMDMIGYAPESLKYAAYDASYFDRVADFIESVNKKTKSNFVFDFWRGFESDFRSGIARGIPSVAFFEDPRTKTGEALEYYPWYHSSKDRVDKMNFRYANKFSRFIASLALEAANSRLNFDNARSKKALARSRKGAKRRVRNVEKFDTNSDPILCP